MCCQSGTVGANKSPLVPEGGTRPLGGGFTREKNCCLGKSFLTVVLSENVMYGSEPPVTGSVQTKAHNSIDSIQTPDKRPEIQTLQFLQTVILGFLLCPRLGSMRTALELESALHRLGESRGPLLGVSGFRTRLFC